MENLDFNTVGVGVICFYRRCQQSSTKESQAPPQNKMQNGSRLHLSRWYTPLDLCVLKQLPRQNIHCKEPDCPASEEAKLHLDNRLLCWISFFLFCFGILQPQSLLREKIKTATLQSISKGRTTTITAALAPMKLLSVQVCFLKFLVHLQEERASAYTRKNKK